jgi:phosphotriesterase-related protein
MVTDLVRRGFMDRILLSHDAGWYNVGEPSGGAVHPCTAISDELLPVLRGHLTEKQIQAITVANPARAFQPRVRRR